MTHAAWWLLGTLGIGGTLLAVAIFVVGWPVIIGTKIGRMALAIGGGILGIMAVFAKGAAQGAAEAHRKQEKIDEDYIRRREESDRAIDALSDDELDRRLSDGTLIPSVVGDGQGTVLQPITTKGSDTGPKAGRG